MDTVTQAQAQQWLNIEVDQRPVNKHAVKLMVSDMEEGRWDYTSCPAILIDEDTGAVIDGRHRLTALTQRAEGAVGLFDVRMVNARAIDVIDTGRPRTLADTLHTLGYSHPGEIAAILNQSLRWVTGNTGSSKIISRRQQVEHVRGNENIKAAAEFAARWRSRKGVLTLPSGTIGSLYDVSTFGLGVEPLFEFVEAVWTGKGTTDAIRRLTVVINDARNPRTRTALGPDAKSYMIARVYLAFLMDENPTKLYARRRGLFELPGWNEWVDANWKEYA